MGVVFLENLGGKVTYKCSTCKAHLTNKENLISTRFSSTSGPAWLLDRVVNVFHGEADFRSLTTGRHMVRDVFCKRCETQIGWFYEFAAKDSERYKEGKTILERRMIREVREKMD